MATEEPPNRCAGARLENELSPEAAEIARWRAEPWYFAERVLGQDREDPWQDEFYHALVGLRPDGSPLEQRYLRFALQACKGPGKTGGLAGAMWWFMSTRPMPKIVACSITGDNLADNLWPELAKWRQNSNFLKANFEWTKDRVYHRSFPQNWFMSARSWPKSATPEQQAESLAGIHGDNVMMVLDESGSIPPGVLATAEAVLVNVDPGKQREALVLQAGNPTDVAGSLYVAAVKARKLWWVKEITGDPDDPNRARRVSVERSRETIAQYGRNHPYTLVNVMGKFPPGGTNSLIALDKVITAKDRKLSAPRYHDAPKILGVDVARFGDDETCICMRQGPLVYPLWCYRGIDTMQTTGHVARFITEYQPDGVFIDSTGGYGSGVVDRLLELGYIVHGIEFAGSPLNTRAYLNKRAEMWDLMREWLNGEVVIPDDSDLISQLPTPTFKYSSDGLLQLEAKADMKKRGVSSPDRADALALTFAMPVPHKQVGGVRASSVAKMSYDWRSHGR